MSHGTPSHISEVESFYTSIRRGSPPTSDLLAELVARYEAIGGLSPLAAITKDQEESVRRAIRASLEDGSLSGHGYSEFELVSGTKYSTPTIEEAVSSLSGHRLDSVIGVVLSPLYAFTTTDSYFDRMRMALSEGTGLHSQFVESWHTQPAFIDLLSQNLKRAIVESGHPPHDLQIIFSAHSLPLIPGIDPTKPPRGEPYQSQLSEVGTLVATRLKKNMQMTIDNGWSISFQSAGRTSQEWIGPDVRDSIRLAAKNGAKGVIVCPVGFTADNLETLYDIDIEARAVANEAEIELFRTELPNGSPLLGLAIADAIAGELAREK